MRGQLYAADHWFDEADGHHQAKAKSISERVNQAERGRLLHLLPIDNDNMLPKAFDQ
jgi:hypothetical protein